LRRESEDIQDLIKSMIFWLRTGFFFAVLAGAFLWSAVVWLLTRSAIHLRRAFWRSLTRLPEIANVDVRVTGEDHLPKGVGTNLAASVAAGNPHVVIANQQSLLCYTILANLLHRFADCVVVARLVGEWHVPIGTWLWVKTGNIIVDPTNPIRSAIGLKTGLAALRRGTSVWIFPEGTRWKVPGEIGPFKRGAFMMAIDTGVPILPIVVSPLKPRTDLKARVILRNPVEVRVLPPISTQGLTREDLSRLRDQTHEAMQRALNEMVEERTLARTDQSALFAGHGRTTLF